MVKLLKVWRPIGQGTDQNGDSEDSGFEACLKVKLDRYDDGRIIAVERLAFADHAGLEAEFAAQAATTVLEAAVTNLIHSMDWTEDQLSAAQRPVITVNYTES